MPRDTDVLCVHCNCYISRTRERAHRTRLQSNFFLPPPPAIPSRLRRVFDLDVESGSAEEPISGPDLDAHAVGGKSRSSGTPSNVLKNSAAVASIEDAIERAATSISARWNIPLNIDTDNEDSDEPVLSQDEDHDAFDWNRFGAVTESGLSAWDQLGEGYEQDAATTGMSCLSLFDV